MLKKIIYLSILFMLMNNPIWTESAFEIMETVRINRDTESSAMDMTMTLSTKGGDMSTRRLQTLVLSEDGKTKTITIFLEPSSVKNTRFLTMENASSFDDQWIYLPALRKVKRISSGDQKGSFMGSDFSYSDMSSQIAETNDANHKIIGEEILDNLDCFIIESIPKGGTDPSYGKNISWIDKNSRLTIKVEFYSLKSLVKIKVLQMEDLQQIDGKWIATKTSMETLKSGHKTEIEIKEVQFNLNLNPAFFTSNFLKTGRM